MQSKGIMVYLIDFILSRGRQINVDAMKLVGVHPSDRIPSGQWPSDHPGVVATVTGPSRSYLWILSRNKMLDENVVSELVARAKRWGYDMVNLIYVEHDKKGGDQ